MRLQRSGPLLEVQIIESLPDLILDSGNLVGLLSWRGPS